MEELKIRIAAPEDAEAIAEIYRPYFEDGEMLPDAPQKAIDAWEEVKAWYAEYDGDQ